MTDFRIAADGLHVVFRADREVVERFELYSVPTAGGAVRKVSGPLIAEGDVRTDFVIAPDSGSVLYRANPVLRNSVDLLAGSVSGRQPVRRLNALHGTERVVTDFRIAADERTVVYRADSRVDDQFELFAATPGRAPIVLSGALPSAGDVTAFELAGARAVYRAAVAGTAELFAAPLDGTALPLRLSPPLAPGETLLDFAVDAGSRHAVFVVRRADVSRELYAARVDGAGSPERLGDEPQDFWPTPDGARVLFTRAQPDTGVHQLWSARSAGSGPAVVLGTLAPFFTELTGFAHGGRFAIFGLRAFDVTGATPPIELGASLPGTSIQEVVADGVLLTRLSSTVDAESMFARTDLYRVPLAGAPATRVNADFPLSAKSDEVVGFDIAPGATRGACLTGNGELFGFALDGTPAVPLDTPGTGPVRHLRASADGRRTVFVQDGTLYVVPHDGSAGALPLATTQHVRFLTPDGRTAVLVDGEIIRAAPLDGAPVAVLGTLSGGEGRVLASPDSRWVVWLSDPEVHSAPIDGSAPPVDLAAGVPVHVVRDVRISPDAHHVVILDQDYGQLWSLYRSPIDGRAPPEVLASGSGHIRDFEIDAAGERVIYLEFDSGEIHTVPLAGGAPVLLTPSWIDRPFQFELSRDGELVVFLANPSELRQFVYDVFSVPVDGSAAPRKLNQRPAGTATQQYVLAGPLVLSPADHALFPEVDRTVAAALDGSRFDVLVDFVADFPPAPDGKSVVLGRPRWPGAQLFAALLDVEAVRELTPDSRGVQWAFAVGGAGVLYRADLDQEGIDELYLSILGRPRRASGAPTDSAIR